ESYGGKFDLWDLQTGRPTNEDGDRSSAATAFPSPAGDRVVTIGTAAITRWDAATGQRLQSFDLPPYPYREPHRSYSPDGRYALPFGGDFEQSQPLVGDVAAGRLAHPLRPPAPPSPDRSLYITSAFAPDSSLLAIRQDGPNASNAVVRIWDLRTGK